MKSRYLIWWSVPSDFPKKNTHAEADVHNIIVYIKQETDDNFWTGFYDDFV